MSAALLTISNVSKHYGYFRAVDNISFSVAHGEILALIGPNGAGKTTCFNLLMGQSPPTSGTVAFEGQSLHRKTPREIWALGVGRTFQIANVFGSLTVGDNLRVAIQSAGGKSMSIVPRTTPADQALADALLTSVGLQRHVDLAASALPYGDIKRLELAMALASAPKLLLMDEPTAGMAPGEREHMMQLVHRISNERKMAVLFTEHDMDAVFTHADRILVLDRGKLIANGPPAAIRADTAVQAVYLGGGSTFE